ncbi:hypothetical protein [Sphingobacterium sp. BIGb0116]|uniref:hypothetical protein n=1 Tax=Sphingobacterium sp. BIGb0116 TaxID=2940619 RepID=UPI0021671270|nr:hypothetical protein [Sphingobacterium sp. BIGb0116]MCS4164423.1 putative metal-binding protein [Sphingobacterium sp. BIGb0116]
MKKKVLTVIYNMSSGNFSTTRTEILTCFPCNEHKVVHEAIEDLKKDDIVLAIPMRNCLGHFQGVQHYINWDKFTDDMIDQSLITEDKEVDREV